jgi:hypothetical protein
VNNWVAWRTVERDEKGRPGVGLLWHRQDDAEPGVSEALRPTRCGEVPPQAKLWVYSGERAPGPACVECATTRGATITRISVVKEAT